MYLSTSIIYTSLATRIPVDVVVTFVGGAFSTYAGNVLLEVASFRTCCVIPLRSMLILVVPISELAA
jgi:hypothetical protein